MTTHPHPSGAIVETSQRHFWPHWFDGEQLVKVTEKPCASLDESTHVLDNYPEVDGDLELETIER